MKKHHFGRSAVAAATLALSVAVTGPIAQPSTASGFSSLRLVDPAPTQLNSFDLTFDARAEGGWIKYYTPGLRALFMYRNVGSTFSLTFEAKDAAGALLANTPVYLIVNKNWSCSDGKYVTDVDTDYAGDNRPSAKHIVGDWCGDQQKFFGGETSVPGTTDANGRVTFTLTNLNTREEAEVAPVAKNVINTYTPGNLRYLEDPLSLGSTIAASFVKHPVLADDNAEDKDLLFIHFVNPALKAEKATRTVVSANGSIIARFRALNLEGVPQAGVPVNIVQMSGPDEASIEPITGDSNAGIISTTTDAQGWASVTAKITPGVEGDQELVAMIDGTRGSTKMILSWADVKAPAVTKAASISGKVQVGSTLTAVKGTWTGSPAVTYAWAVCTASGKSAAALPAKCSAIKGATKSTFKVPTTARGKYIRVVVKGSNLAGLATTVSASTAKVK